MRGAWWMWSCSVLLVGSFAGGTLGHIVAGGWLAPGPDAAPPFGVAPIALSAPHVTLAVTLFAASHLVRWLVPDRRLAARTCAVFGDVASYRAAPAVVRIPLDAERVARARTGRQEVRLALSLALALGIAVVGVAGARHRFHGPRPNPLDWWIYLAGSVVAIASHAPIRRAAASAVTSASGSSRSGAPSDPSSTSRRPRR